jgi:RNA polymerase sigma-70 factor (ECF subfamily)
MLGLRPRKLLHGVHTSDTLVLSGGNSFFLEIDLGCFRSSNSRRTIMAEVQPDSAATQDLLKQARKGDPQAFQELFERYRAYLHQFVELRLDRRLRSRVDPSDVVQDAQLEAVRRHKDYLEQPPMPFRLWLRQIAFDRILKMHRHHATTARRAIGREQSLPEHSSLLLAQQLLSPGSTPSQQVRRQEMVDRLRQAMNQLSDGDREILLLRNFEGLSNQEVGYLLGIDPATASQRHGRAMLRLHKILSASGITESQL